MTYTKACSLVLAALVGLPVAGHAQSQEVKDAFTKKN